MLVVQHAFLYAGPFGVTAVNLCNIYHEGTEILSETCAENSTETLGNLKENLMKFGISRRVFNAFGVPNEDYGDILDKKRKLRMKIKFCETL